MKNGRRILVGVISDTHGLLRESAVHALQGSDLIIHAGDVGQGAILQALEEVAPTFAVRGNVDRGEWAQSLPASLVVEEGSSSLYILHDILDLDLEPAAAGFNAVISGHSHSPEILWRKGVLYLNPGSAGPRRFRLPVSLAHLFIQEDELDAEIVHL